jgi:hypothetical protein
VANYDVMRHGNGWADRREGAHRVSATYRTQAEAAAGAKQHVINSGGGEARINGRDNRFRDSNTYGRNDPYPPRG